MQLANAYLAMCQLASVIRFDFSMTIGEIRASGSLGGVSGFQVSVGKGVYTPR